MKRLVLLTWLLATFINSDLLSQSKEELKNNFYDAESWILFEAYQDALPLYLQLLKSYPDNSNFKYRIGQCYINIPGEKAKAASYLEEAVKNIDPKYKEGRFNETGAPYDALYYLANAYRITNQLDKALTTYEQFRKNLNPLVYDSTIVNLQIQSCRNATELMRMPLFIKYKNLGRTINSVNNDYNPVISDKEDMLVFSRSLAFYDALLYSTKVNGKWTEPQNMNGLLKVDRDLFPTSISKDGKDLYLYSSADYDGIIYTSRFEKGTWSPIVKLNDNINTKYWESHATISHDNKKLYFTSNRKGTYGGLDIYVSNRDSTGDWGPAINLGPVINTPYNEESPFLSEDDKTLFFSSRGHFNMGGYDVFYSTLLANGAWSVPLNLGYPLNTTDDDVFFKPLNHGFEGYISKELPGGYGKQDIYRIEIFSNDHPRKFFVRGMAKVADLINSMNDSVKVTALNIKNPNQTVIVYSNPKTGEYEFQVPQGDYQVTYDGKGGEKVVRKLDLPLQNPSDSFLLPETILPKTEFIAEPKVETNKTISVTKGDSAREKNITRQPVSQPGKITPQDLNRIAPPVLAESDSAIEILRNKILAFGESSPTADLIRQTVTTVDQGNIKSREKWLEAYYDEALKRGLTQKQIADMIVLICSSPDTKVEAYLDDLARLSEEPFASALKSADLKKEGIKTPEDLIIYLINNKEKYTEDAVFRSIANLIVKKNVPIESIKSQFVTGKPSYLWILWVLLGAGVLSLILIFWRRKKNREKEK